MENNILAGRTASPERKRIFSMMLKTVVSLVLVGWLLHKIGIENLFAQISRANPRWILLSLMVFSISNLLGALQWYGLLRLKDISLPFYKVLLYYHVGLFFNNFLIGNIGGDAFRVYDIHKSSGNSKSAISTVIFDRFIGFFALSSLAMITALFWIHQIGSQSTFFTTIGILLSWVLIITVLFRENWAKMFSWSIKTWLPQSIYDKLKVIYYDLNQFRHHKMMLLWILMVSFCVQFLRIITHLFAARAVGVQTNFVYFLVFIPIIALFASLPISLGGLGVREQSGVALFLKVGVGSAQVVVFEFIAYLIGIFASLPGGIYFAFRKEIQRHHVS